MPRHLRKDVTSTRGEQVLDAIHDLGGHLGTRAVLVDHEDRGQVDGRAVAERRQGRSEVHIGHDGKP